MGNKGICNCQPAEEGKNELEEIKRNTLSNNSVYNITKFSMTNTVIYDAE